MWRFWQLFASAWHSSAAILAVHRRAMHKLRVHWGSIGPKLLGSLETTQTHCVNTVNTCEHPRQKKKAHATLAAVVRVSLKLQLIVLIFRLDFDKRPALKKVLPVALVPLTRAICSGQTYCLQGGEKMCRQNPSRRIRLADPLLLWTSIISNHHWYVISRFFEYVLHVSIQFPWFKCIVSNAKFLQISECFTLFTLANGQLRHFSNIAAHVLEPLRLFQSCSAEQNASMMTRGRLEIVRIYSTILIA